MECLGRLHHHGHRHHRRLSGDPAQRQPHSSGARQRGWCTREQRASAGGRSLPIQRSANALATGTRTGVRKILRTSQLVMSMMRRRNSAEVQGRPGTRQGWVQWRAIRCGVRSAVGAGQRHEQPIQNPTHRTPGCKRIMPGQPHDHILGTHWAVSQHNAVGNPSALRASTHL